MEELNSADVVETLFEVHLPEGEFATVDTEEEFTNGKEEGHE